VRLENEGAVLRSAVSVAVAVSVFGLSFGVLAAEAGLGAGKAAAMSLLVFSGGSQFASVSVVMAGGTQAGAVVSGLLLNVRLLPFGVTVAHLLGPGRLRRAVGAQLVVDESTALATATPDRRLGRSAFWWSGAALFVGWNAATVLGVEAGQLFGSPEGIGLDGAFPAVFVALLVPRLREPGATVAAVVGAAVALVLVPLAPPGVGVLAATLGALAAVRASR
jgi:predicted branched-subunit amino acid permease